MKETVKSPAFIVPIILAVLSALTLYLPFQNAINNFLRLDDSMRDEIRHNVEYFLTVDLFVVTTLGIIVLLIPRSKDIAIKTLQLTRDYSPNGAEHGQIRNFRSAKSRNQFRDFVLDEFSDGTTFDQDVYASTSLFQEVDDSYLRKIADLIRNKNLAFLFGRFFNR